MTRKWIPVLLLFLVIAGILAAGQARDKEKRLMQSLRPLVKEGTACVTASMELALEPEAADYNEAVGRFKQYLFDLEQRIQAVEELANDAYPETSAALVYLRSGQSVIRELYRSSHAARALDGARVRMWESRRTVGEHDDGSDAIPAVLQRAQRDTAELHLNRNVTVGRLTHAARTFRKNIVQYRSMLGAEQLSSPEMVTTLISRANQLKNR